MKLVNGMNVMINGGEGMPKYSLKGLDIDSVHNKFVEAAPSLRKLKDRIKKENEITNEDVLKPGDKLYFSSKVTGRVEPIVDNGAAYNKFIEATGE